MRKIKFNLLKIIWRATLTLFVYVVGITLGTFIFLNLCTFLFNEQFIEFITRTFGVLSIYPAQNEITSEEWDSIQTLIKSGHILTQDQFLSVLSEFYNNIINILIVVISFMGIIAYLSIRAISREKAEEIAEKETERAISKRLSDENIQNILNKDGLISDLINFTNEDRPELVNDMRNIKDRITALENWLMQSGDEKEENKNIKIVIKDEENGDTAKKDK